MLGRMGGVQVKKSLDCWVGWMGLVGVGGGLDWFNQTEDSERRIGVVEGLVGKGWIGSVGVMDRTNLMSLLENQLDRWDSLYWSGGWDRWNSLDWAGGWDRWGSLDLAGGWDGWDNLDWAGGWDG